MDIDSKKLAKYIPIGIFVVLILIFFVFLFARNQNDQVVIEDTTYKVFYEPNLETYTVTLSDQFYNREAEEIIDDINKITDATNGSTDAFVDAPAFLFGTTDIENEKLEQLDPNIFLNDPNNGYPGD